MCVLSVPFPALVHYSWLGIAHLPQTGFGMAGDRSNTTAAVPAVSCTCTKPKTLCTGRLRASGLLDIPVA